MRIGLIGRHGPDTFVANIGDALAQMGHRVTHLGATGVDRGPRPAVRTAKRLFGVLPGLEEWFQHRLARLALEHECEAVITTNARLAPAAVTAMRRNRIPVALWFPDAVSNLGRQQLFTADYTALFSKEPFLVERLRRLLDRPAWYLPQACNPRWHRPVCEPGTQQAVAVVGNMYRSRLALLRRLHQAGVPLAVYGPPVPRWARELLPPGRHAGRPVFREDKSRVFRGHAAVLNNLHPSELRGLNLRLFEATAAGGAVLCERRSTLAELYDLDTEIASFDDFDELVDRCRMLLADSELTRKLGDAATRRAHAEHTYEHRLPVILEKLV